MVSTESSAVKNAEYCNPSCTGLLEKEVCTALFVRSFSPDGDLAELLRLARIKGMIFRKAALVSLEALNGSLFRRYRR